MPVLPSSVEEQSTANATASALARYATRTSPTQGSLLSLMSNYSSQGQEIFSPNDNSLRAQIARSAGRQQVEDPSTIFGTILNELMRPQKALFAGMYSLRTGGDIADAIQESLDEFTSGFGQGSFKRDIQFGDILDPDNPTGSRSPAMAALSFAGDLAVDPLMFVPGKVLSAPFLGASKLATMGITSAEKIPLVGTGVTRATQALREAFLTSAGSPAGQFASERLADLRRFVENHRSTLVENARSDAAAIKTFAQEAGMEIDEVKRLMVKHIEGTKINQKARFLIDSEGVASDQARVISGGRRPSEALEDTMIRLYNDYGLRAFDDYTESAANRLIMNERPIRQAILRGKVADMEKELVSQIGRDKVNHLSDLILEFKDRNLERFIFEARERVFPDNRKLKLFQSMEKDYLMLSMTQEGQKLIQDMGLAKLTVSGFEVNPTIASDLHSKFQKLGISEVNRLARAGELKINGNKVPALKFALFEEDPIIIDSIRTYYSRKSVEQIRALEDIANGYGRLITDADLTKKGKLRKAVKNKLAEDELVLLKNIEGFERIAVPSEVANMIQKKFTVLKDPDFVNSFAESITGAQNMWKAWTIFPFPEFHFRNFIGNHWNMFLGGMKPIDMPFYNGLATWVNSTNLDRGIGKRLGDVMGKALPKGDEITLGGTKYARQELLDTMNELGILRAGFYGSGELPVSLRKTVQFAERSPARNLLSLSIEGNPVLRKGIKAAGAIEDTQRGAMFLWALNEGMDTKQARDMVFKHLFDYSDLTDFEQRVFRNFLFPFYAWTRKNIPLQLEYLVKDPHKFSAIQKAKETIEAQTTSGDAPDNHILAEFIREGTNVRVRRKPDGEYEYWVLNNWLPASDLSEIDSAEELFKKLPMEQLGPLFKIPMEQLFEEYTFFEKEFKPGATEFAGIRMGDRAQALLRNVRFLSLIDRFTQEDSPGLTQNLVRLLTGAKAYTQNVEKGTRIYNARKQEAINEINSAIRRALESQDVDEAQRLFEQRSKFVTGELIP